MTDNEIIKALEYCSQQGITSECERCKVKGCRSELIKLALDLINRQKTEIEKLEDEVHKGHIAFQKRGNFYRKEIETAKAEAYKEFAEKLEERIAVKLLRNKSNEYAEGFADALDGVNGELNNLLKELVGE